MNAVTELERSEMTHLQPSPADLLARFCLKSSSIKIWLVTGGRGAGKTTWCSALVQAARQAGLTTGGFLTPAVYANGRKQSFSLLNLLTDENRPFAQLQTGQATVGCWQFDDAVLAWGNQIAQDSTAADVVVIDELGPLEFEQGRGFQTAMGLLDASAFRCAFVIVRPELLAAAQSRWPQADVVTIGEDVHDCCT
jgi:nucleoside-triphosphatase